MKTEKAGREKLLGTKPSKPTSFNSFTAINGEGNKISSETNNPKLASTMMEDGENKISLDTLKLASTLANEIIESDDEDTIVVDVEGARARSLDAATAVSKVKQSNKEIKLTRSESPVRTTGRKATSKKISSSIIKTAGTAPIATMVSGRAQETPMQGPGMSAGIRKMTDSKNAATEVSSLQGSSRDANRLKRHCESVAAQVGTLLGTEALADMADWASPKEQALAQDLKVTFETTMRHLESDIAYIFKKHGGGL